MGIFDNDDFLNDDFLSRWEKFNKRIENDDEFREEMERAQKDFQELMKMLLNKKDFGSPLDFRIIPINNSYKTPDYKIPEDEINIEKGQDENGDWETKNWTSPDGSISFSSFSRSSSFDDFNSLNDDIADIWGSKLRNRKTKRTSPEESNKLKIVKLQKALDYMVEQEKYEEATELKKMIDELKSEK